MKNGFEQVPTCTMVLKDDKEVNKIVLEMKLLFIISLIYKIA